MKATDNLKKSVDNMAEQSFNQANQTIDTLCINITRAELCDIDVVFKLNQENNARPYPLNVLKEIFESGDYIFKVNVSADYNANDNCIGYVITRLVYDDGEIISIVIDKLVRNRGVGQKLLQYAVGELYKNGATRVLLEVEETNHAAIALYKKAGFKQISIRQRYYGENSALIMQYD